MWILSTAFNSAKRVDLPIAFVVLVLLVAVACTFCASGFGSSNDLVYGGF